MDKMFQNNSGEQSEHPPREMLLLFVDGELPAKETTQLEAHLEASQTSSSLTKRCSHPDSIRLKAGGTLINN